MHRSQEASSASAREKNGPPWNGCCCRCRRRWDISITSHVLAPFPDWGVRGVLDCWTSEGLTMDPDQRKHHWNAFSSSESNSTSRSQSDCQPLVLPGMAKSHLNLNADRLYIWFRVQVGWRSNSFQEAAHLSEIHLGLFRWSVWLTFPAHPKVLKNLLRSCWWRMRGVEIMTRATCGLSAFHNFGLVSSDCYRFIPACAWYLAPPAFLPQTQVLQVL